MKPKQQQKRNKMDKQNPNWMAIRFPKATLCVFKQQIGIGERLVLCFLCACYLVIIYAPKLVQLGTMHHSYAVLFGQKAWMIES